VPLSKRKKLTLSTQLKALRSYYEWSDEPRPDAALSHLEEIQLVETNARNMFLDAYRYAKSEEAKEVLSALKGRLDGETRSLINRLGEVTLFERDVVFTQERDDTGAETSRKKPVRDPSLSSEVLN